MFYSGLGNTVLVALKSCVYYEKRILIFFCCCSICLYLGAQDISQVMTSQGMVSSSNGQHEITLTINNSSLSQVLAHASGSTTTTSSGSPQEITLTISGWYF